MNTNAKMMSAYRKQSSAM